MLRLRRASLKRLPTPNKMPRWWGQPGLHRITGWKGDLRSGGKWSSTGLRDDGTSYTIEGEYLKVDPPRLLVMTWIPSWVGPMSTVLRWELEAHEVHGLHPNGPRKAGTGTLVKIRHEGFASSAAALAGHHKGWQSVLVWLQGYLENGDTVDSRKKLLIA